MPERGAVAAGNEICEGPTASFERNRRIADLFRQAAELLSAQGANPFRVGAYRRAAATLEALDRDLAVIVTEGGFAALDALPGIGPSLARAIGEILASGRWTFLEWLKGAVDPEALLQSVPGVGPRLARRFHDELGLETLEALEVAAHDGRMRTLAGIGDRRLAIIRAGVAERLARVRPVVRPRAEPDIATLLDVDREYRSKAMRDELPRIAPRRFNPSGRAWLPVLHTTRGEWSLMALFSNTSRAHDLGRTGDWVVLYFHDDGLVEGQRTVVTAGRGTLAGCRVVRGREAECLHHYGLDERRSIRDPACGRQGRDVV